MRTFVRLFAVVSNLVLLDAIAKELAAHFLRGSAAIPVIPGFFDLAYVENRGCAWGMFQGHVWPLAAFALVAMGVLVWKRRDLFGWREGASRLRRLLLSAAEPLLYAGIVGNLIDRLFRGCVIDFLDFHWQAAYHFPCFNLADTFICVAAGLMILCSGEKRVIS